MRRPSLFFLAILLLASGAFFAVSPASAQAQAPSGETHPLSVRDMLAMFGTVLALWITGTSLNVVSLLGASIGVGIVAKNGILMLDFVKELRSQGLGLAEALVRSGRRRLRPVLMTSMAAALGMLPLAYGIGSGADMLKPLAIAVIGALCISVLLSLIATPTIYYLMVRRRKAGSAEAV